MHVGAPKEVMYKNLTVVVINPTVGLGCQNFCQTSILYWLCSKVLCVPPNPPNSHRAATSCYSAVEPDTSHFPCGWGQQCRGNNRKMCTLVQFRNLSQSWTHSKNCVLEKKIIAKKVSHS